MEDTMQQLIDREVINNAMNYKQYRNMIQELLSENKTTGTNQDDEMVEYTRMNEQRMRRLDKQISINDSLKKKLSNVEDSWLWLVITEGWCGDAAQNVPVIAKMADASDQIDLKLILRDEHTDIIDNYLTNGGRSIPILVCLDAETLNEVGSWGPRPGNLQQQAMQWKDNPELSKEEWGEKLHKWYAKNKGQQIQSDFEDLITKWMD